MIALLLELDHDVYIVSGGLLEPVREFGISLGVATDNIRAVGVAYDELAGSWWARHGGDDRYLDYGKGALAMSEGKAQIIAELVGEAKGRRMLVGDGVSDLLASEAVDLFVGFGGVAARPRVRADAPVFINEMTLSPTLPLAAGPSSTDRLNHPVSRDLFAGGLTAALSAEWNDAGLRSEFSAAANR